MTPKKRQHEDMRMTARLACQRFKEKKSLNCDHFLMKRLEFQVHLIFHGASTTRRVNT